KQVILENKLISEDVIKQEWWNYLRPLWKILITFEKNNRVDAESRCSSNKRDRGLHLFMILPHTSFYQWFVLIDTDALYQIFSKINFCGLGKISKSDFSKNIEEWWRVAFQIDKEVTKQDIPVNAYGFDKEGNFYPLDVRDNNRIVGLDSGRKDLFVAMSEEKNQLDAQLKNGIY
ncbi:9395_t:CDS:2, partial [Gigaspora rosea]